MAWEDDQRWEAEWWGDCLNTYGEEQKQLTYADRMGLQAETVDGHFPVYDLQGASVLDLGGGPVSMLLKSTNAGERRTVVDPLDVPSWVLARYVAAGIELVQSPAEEFLAAQPYDEVWLYNVLQHTLDPGKIIQVARDSGQLIRIFEWIETPVSVGHPHTLRRIQLDSWLGGRGRVETVNDMNGCVGRCYHGVFR